MEESPPLLEEAEEAIEGDVLCVEALVRHATQTQKTAEPRRKVCCGRGVWSAGVVVSRCELKWIMA